MQKAKSGQLLTFLMDANQGVVTERAKIRADFVKKDNDLHNQDTKDLENTLKINKNLISILISDHNNIEAKSKDALLMLNQENTYLQNNIKLLKSQRDHYHTQCLILKQMSENLKAKHLEDLNEQKVKVSELLESLNKKEYTIQSIQHKFNEVVETLRENSKGDGKIANLLWQIDTTPIDGMITNVIRENKLLAEEIARINEKLRKLEEKSEKSVDTKEELGIKSERKSNCIKTEEENAVEARQWNKLESSVVSLGNEGDEVYEKSLDITLEERSDYFKDISCILNKMN